MCQSDDPDVDFRVFDETCEAMRKRARHEERQKKDAKREGVIVGIEAYTHSDTPLDQFRTPYYRGLAEKREAREAERIIRPREHPPGWTPEDDA